MVMQQGEMRNNDENEAKHYSYFLNLTFSRSSLNQQCAHKELLIECEYDEFFMPSVLYVIHIPKF